MSGLAPLAILDRDGTLIDLVRDEETGAIVTAFHPAQLRLLPGAVEGLRALAGAGFVLAMATNQPGPAKGQISRLAVARTNAALLALLDAQGVSIAAVEVCEHHPQGGPGGDPALVRTCDCRKPRPGMLRSLLARLGGDAARSWAIGDSPADVEAGRAAGLRTALLVPTSRCELCPLRGRPDPGADVLGPTLLEIATAIAGQM
ncbi:MAG TPA: HAD-IIIA family hydrolase [Myxococcaceae bacterium]|nr:HAD-IIIA family hydrolase [Myxococcaceae bacterium]